MEKMEMFSKWRIDPSLIEFPKDGVELHGGHATVSRAMLNAANSNFGGNTDGVDAPQDARQKVGGWLHLYSHIQRLPDCRITGCRSQKNANTVR